MTAFHPKISVLVPVYNGERFLAEALESVLNQSFRDFELIAIDDGSSDRTWEILHDFAFKDKRVRIFQNDENLGLSKTLTSGFAKCSGDYFVRHDGDDISLPDRFERQVKFLDQNPSIGAVGTMTEYIGQDGIFLGKGHQAWSWKEIQAHLLIINCFCNSSMMMRCELVKKAGGLSSPSKWAEDYEFLERFSHISEMAVLPEILFHYRFWENYFTRIHRKEQMSDAFQISLRAIRRRLGNPNFGEAAYRRFWYSYFEQEGLINDEKTQLELGDSHKLRPLWEFLSKDETFRKVWGHAFDIQPVQFQNGAQRIYYLCSDYSTPSWGSGLLYHHVALLRKLGFEAFILHDKSPFRLKWLDTEVPIQYIDSPDFSLAPEDILIVPEVNVNDSFAVQAECRKIAFIQGSFLITANLEEPPDYAGSGYEAMMKILPHAEIILKKYFGGIPVHVIPPFVAPYFFLYPEDVEKIPRKNQILLYSKKDSQDYGIFKKMLLRELSKINMDPSGPGPWEILELEGITNIEVALAMRQASFFVNLNTHEAFNSTVPEAMAAGCVCICYEAVGPKDFLKDGENAFLFNNHHIYELLGCLLDLIRDEKKNQKKIKRMRLDAYRTACQYRQEKTEQALSCFYGETVSL